MIIIRKQPLGPKEVDVEPWGGKDAELKGIRVLCGCPEDKRGPILSGLKLGTEAMPLLIGKPGTVILIKRRGREIFIYFI